MNMTTMKLREHSALFYLIICFLLTIAILIAVSCKKGDSVKLSPTVKQLSFTKSQKALVASSNNFGFRLFQKLDSATASDSNLFISPVSVSLALAMTYNGSDGITKTAFEQTLGLSGLSVDDINLSYQGVMNNLSSLDTKVDLNIANSIWYRNTFTVQQSFISTNQTYYDAEVSGIDFTDKASVSTINKWVDENTNHKISSIINSISPNAVMYLINAIYFKGTWTYKFDSSKTVSMDFNMINGTVESVPFMVQEDTFSYFANTVFNSVELPYGQGNYTMLILLPNQGYTVGNITANLSDENLSNWIGQMNKKAVQIYLPKFKINYSTSLNQPLIDLGLAIAFTSNADFSKINPSIPLCISEVKHKSFVEVNEEGTEAAAVTSVSMITTSAGPGNAPIMFYVDHPFLFAIREVSTNTIIFIGKVGNIQ